MKYFLIRWLLCSQSLVCIFHNRIRQGNNRVRVSCKWAFINSLFSYEVTCNRGAYILDSTLCYVPGCGAAD